MIRWETIGEEKFNRAVELLITRTIEADNPGLTVTAVDGRGGDGGIDLDARVKKTDQLVTIYQLKHFPEGFSGAWGRSRKPQIKASFDSAKEHAPAKWVLVIPRNFTPKERSFVTSLRRGSEHIRIERIGVTELDIMLSRFPEVEDYINREPNLAALKEVGRQSALLAKPEDLATEVGQIQKRLEARSIYWGANFRKTGNQYFEELVPLRPDAAEREPLSFTLKTDFSSEMALGEEFRRALEYGSFKSVQLPANVVTQLEKFGPDWFAGVIEGLEVELSSTAQDLKVPAKVVLQSGEGKTIAQPTCLTATVTSGPKGAQLRFEVVAGVEFQLVLDKKPAKEGNLRYEVDLHGLSGTTAKRSLKFLSSLSTARQMRIEIGALRALEIQIDDTAAAPDVALVELADDLAALENELGVEFSIPAKGPRNHERLWIRAIRQVFDGEAVHVPGADDLSFTVTPPIDDETRRWLTREGIAVGLHVDDWEWEILGQRIIVGNVCFAVFEGRAVDGPTHLAAIEKGDMTPRTVRFASSEENRGVLMYDAERRKQDEPLTPTRWGLTGIADHKYFDVD